MKKLDFEVVESLDDFFFSEKFISLVVGPVGSTKTTGCILKILYHASRMAPCSDGVRRSRAVWVRNTREQLRDTSIPDFLKWFPDGELCTFFKTEYRALIKVGDIECDVLFRGLDDDKDVRRLLSLQASFGVLDEFREINAQVFEQLQGRLGRYPDGKMVPHRPEWGVDSKGNPIQGCVRDDGAPNKFLWGASNPPDMDTYWEDFLTEPPANAHVTIQPSAFAPEADWHRFLPTDYYENLAEGKSEDWVDVYIHAKFGKSLSGHPVHRSFSRDVHIAKESLKYNPLASSGLLIGMDLALNPAAVIGQLDNGGRLMVLDCLHASGMGALRFLRNILKPHLATKYPGARVLVVCDPSGIRRMDTDEETVVRLIKAEGLAVKPVKTNRLPPRIAAVDNFLTRHIDGKSMLLIDPGCDMLIKALAGKYRFKLKKPGTRDEQADDEPEKLHPWSDIADAFQYLCLHADSGSIWGGATAVVRKEVRPAPSKWAA